MIEAITGTMFEYIDWMSQQVVAVYEDERERWLENQNSLRALRVREVLAASKTVDVDAATNSIRYPLRWHHLGLVMWYPDTGAEGDELGRLQRYLRELGESAGAAPLRSSWPPTEAADGAGCRIVPRWTMQQRRFASSPWRDRIPRAWQSERWQTVSRDFASHTARRRGSQRRGDSQGPEPTVISATDPGLSVVARLGGDVADTRDWVAAVLGGLADDTENDGRLRETLRLFLACGSSYKVAAEELNLHFNSVKYRVGRAVARRGREIGSDRLDVELALLACHWYGAAVLRPT